MSALGRSASSRIGDTTPRGAYDALAKLEEHGVLREITKRKRDRLWSAPDVFEVVDDLERRIGRRRRPRREVIRNV